MIIIIKKKDFDDYNILKNKENIIIEYNMKYKNNFIFAKFLYEELYKSFNTKIKKIKTNRILNRFNNISIQISIDEKSIKQKDIFKKIINFINWKE